MYGNTGRFAEPSTDALGRYPFFVGGLLDDGGTDLDDGADCYCYYCYCCSSSLLPLRRVTLCCIIQRRFTGLWSWLSA